VVRPRERSAWLDLFRSRGRRHQAEAQFETAKAAASLRRARPDRDAPWPATHQALEKQFRKWEPLLLELVKDPETGVVARYNTACFYGVAASLLGSGELLDGKDLEHLQQETVTLLWSCQRVPGSPGPDLSWIMRDPDLKAVRDSETFARFREVLEGGRRDLRETDEPERRTRPSEATVG
jgi:hypothetical protein